MTMTADIGAPVSAAMEEVIKTFDDELRSDLPFTNRLLDQLRTDRGKLLRPKLLLLSGKAAGGLRRDHVVLAAVVEMVHLATLVHDDVLDEADLRRRCPTVNNTLGNEGAVLLGDYLISHAYHLCSSLGSTHASRRIAAATNTVCEGELLQIQNRGNLDLDEPTYLDIIRRKTATLTSVCCELAATVSDAEPETITHLGAFGMDLGIAFQIVDDLLDLTSTECEIGKTVGRDADLGKLTLPLIRFLDQASPEQRRRFRAVLSDHAPNKAEHIRSILEGSDATEYALDTARSYVQSATAHLADLPPGDAKDALIAAAELILHRLQ